MSVFKSTMPWTALYKKASPPERIAHDLAEGVDSISLAVGSAERAQIVHRAVVQEGMRFGVAGNSRNTRYLAVGIDCITPGYHFRRAHPDRACAVTRIQEGAIPVDGVGITRHLAARVNSNSEAFTST